MDGLPAYEGILIRPPSEADSLIFQVTLGCSDNNCTFCPAYKKKKFKVKDIQDIEEDMRKCSPSHKDTRKIFLADGDAMVISQEKLAEVLILAGKYFPSLKRAGIYASPKSLNKKTVKGLVELKKLKLGIIYLGIETGDEDVYRSIRKWGSPEKTVEESLKIKQAGIKLNTTIILGLGGVTRSREHAFNTSSVINRVQPDHVAALTLMAVKGTEIFDLMKKGGFVLPDRIGMVRELYELIDNLDDFKCLFFSNHASNYFPVQGRFPRDKSKILAELKKILESGDGSELREEYMRGL